MSATTIKSALSDAMKEAMKARDKERLAAIRLILAEFKRVEVDERIEIDDERALTILDKMVKQRRESIKQYEAGNRQELADREQAEIDIIQDFLPAQLAPEDLEGLVDEAIARAGAESIKDMGKVMAILKPLVQGRADMGAVSQAVKARLQ